MSSGAVTQQPTVYFPTPTPPPSWRTRDAPHAEGPAPARPQVHRAVPLPAAAETASGVELGWEPWSGAQSLVAAAQAAAQAAIQPRPPPLPPASLLLEVSSPASTLCFWESRHSMHTSNPIGR